MNYFLSDKERKKLIEAHVCSSYTTYRGVSRLKTIKLAENYVISGIPCKAGYPIFFDYNQYFEDGRFIILSEDIELPTTKTNDLFPFAAGTPLNFGYKGKIRSGILSRDFNYNGIIFKARTKVTFQTWGSQNDFWSGVIKHNEIIDNCCCLAGTEVTFEKGSLQTFHPAFEGCKDYKGVEKGIGEECVLFPY